MNLDRAKTNDKLSLAYFYKYFGGIIIMMNTVLAIKNRIHILEMRDPVVNHNIIQKLKRKLRSLEKSS